MRWSSRFDLRTVVLDGLLEGSLVGLAYVAVSAVFSHNGGAVPLPAFWIAAGAGLAAARLHVRWLRDFVSVPVLALAAGAAGWLLEPEAASALLRHDVARALAIHPLGWIVALAVFRGAVHSHTTREADIVTTAVAFSFPLLGVCVAVAFFAGGGFSPVALTGSAVCIVAGMLSLGLARIRDLEAAAPVVESSGSAWRQISGGIVVLAGVSIAVALIVGTFAADPLLRAIVWAANVTTALAAEVLGALARLITDVFGVPGPMRPLPPPPPIRSFGQQSGGPFVPPAQVLPIAQIALVVLAGLALVGFAFLQRYARRWRPRTRPRRERIPIHQEKERIAGPRSLSLRRLLPSLRPGLPFRRRKPATAIEAYLAFLDDLSAEEDLERQSDETPHDHARRVAATPGLEERSVAFLAADYQLAAYGRVGITDRETARAVRRWTRLHRLARRLPAQDARGD